MGNQRRSAKSQYDNLLYTYDGNGHQIPTLDAPPYDFGGSGASTIPDLSQGLWTTNMPMHAVNSQDQHLFEDLFDTKHDRAVSATGEASKTWDNSDNPSTWSISIEDSSKDNAGITPARESALQWHPDIPGFAGLTSKEKYLLFLKDECKSSWKEISEAFVDAYNETPQLPALQMRYRRLKQRLHALDSARTWGDRDTQAFLLARDYYLTKRDEIISEKMRDYGATQKWSPETCAVKYKELALTAPVRERKGSKKPSDEELRTRSQ